MRIGLLGAVTLWSAEGEPTVPGGTLVRGLLARLALDAGRPISSPVLADDLWGAAAPDGATNALQTLVSRLRRALGDTGLVRTEPGGYRLAVPANAVDAVRFEELVAQAERIAAAEPARALELLARAAELWRGPPLADLTELPFALAAADRLTERRALAVEHAARLALAEGEPHAEIAPLRALLAEQPLREPTAALLARVLHAAGRRADALDVLDRTRAALAEQLGVDPGAELAAVHLHILRDPGPPAPCPAPVTAALRATTAGPTPLTPALTSFVGRDTDLRRIRAALQSCRLVTLTGPGGVGKTRLARETVSSLNGAGPDTAERSVPGPHTAGNGTRPVVKVAELAPLAQAAELPAAVLAAVGAADLRVPGQDLGGERGDPDTTERLLAAVAGRPLLLVLDNCEHLVAAVARLVERMLLHAPELRILATSREPLGIAGEQLHPVDALAPTDAARLFADRARSVRPDFDPVEAAAEVAEICRRLDGQPLALELAAARLRTLSPAEIAARLDDRFRLLTTGSRTAPTRHQTLRAVVDWSWDLLEGPERALLRRLAVFAGSATLESIEQVCTGDGGPGEADALEVLAALVDKSLVQAVPAPDGGPTRYRMLETIRVFAAERLAESGEQARVARAHTDHFLALARRADAHLRGADQLRWMGRLRAEQDNLLAAVRHSIAVPDAPNALRLTAALGWYWMARGLWTEAGELLGAACALPLGEPDPGTDPPPIEERALSLALLAAVGSQFGELEAARKHAAEAVALIGQLPPGPPRLTLSLLVKPVVAVFTRGDLGPLEELSERPDLVDVDGPAGAEGRWVRAFALHVRAVVAENRGDLAAQRRLLRRSHDDFRELGDRFGLGMTACGVGELEELAGDLDAAVAAYQEAVALATELGNEDDRPQFTALVARATARRGDPDAARAALRPFLDPASSRDQSGAPLLGILVEVERLAGNRDAARRAMRAAEAASRTTARNPGAPQREAYLATANAALAADEGDLDGAREALRTAFEAAVLGRDAPVIALVAEQAARVAALSGAFELAGRMLGVAVAHRGTLDLGNPDVCTTLDAVRSALGLAGADAATEAGRSLPRADGIALARSWLA